MNYERSFFDPIGNRFVIPQIEVENLIENFLHGKMPLNNGPAFLHEFSHYCCLNTPVGWALSAVNLSSRIRITTFQDGESEQTEGKNAVYRYIATFILLRPMLEGIALFNEHDVRVGNSKIISKELHFFSQIFRAPSVDRERDEINAGQLDDYINLALDESRQTKEHTDKKMSLFLGDFNPENECHILGYLTVKNLFAAAYDRYPSKLTRDPDVFIQFLKAFIFSDWKLVELLLDDDQNVIDAVKNISKHLEERFDKFIKLNFDKELTQFENRTDRNLHDSLLVELNETTLQFIFEKEKFPNNSKKGKQLLTAYLQRNIYDNFNTNNSKKKLEAFHQSIIVNLHVVSIGSTRMRGNILDSNKIELINERGTCTFLLKIAKPPPVDWDGFVQVDLLVMPSELSTMVAFSMNNEFHTLYHRLKSKRAKQILTSLERNYSPRDVFNSTMDSYNEATDLLLANFRTDFTVSFVKKLYYPIISMFMPPHDGQNIDTLLSMETNFSSLTGSYEEKFRLAKLSLNASKYINSKYDKHFIDEVLKTNARLIYTFRFLPFILFRDGRIISVL